MASHRHSTVQIGIAALASTLCIASSSALAIPGALPLAAPVSGLTASPVAENDACLASALCNLQQRVGRSRPAWTPAFCARLAQGVVASARRHDLAPALLVAVMINESDLDEKAARVSRPHGTLAKDSGLMGIRCVVGARGRCTNGLVRGVPWRSVMDPLTNVELGAVYLAYYRDGGGRSRITVRTRQPDGTVRTAVRNIPCRHLDHAYWAHYNHGTRYIAHGPPRFYAPHVAILQDALVETLGLDRETAIAPRYTLRALQRADRPTGQRYVQLCGLIRASNGLCVAAPPTLTARNESPPAARL
jgi:Transglycosylase SLT domain